MVTQFLDSSSKDFFYNEEREKIQRNSVDKFLLYHKHWRIKRTIIFDEVTSDSALLLWVG